MLQSIKDANNRRADEILNNESDPDSAMDNIPPNASKTKRKEIEDEVKRMKKSELSWINKYGNPEFSVESLDRELERLREQLENSKDDPKAVKDLAFKIKVLENIKAVKLDPKNIAAEESKQSEVVAKEKIEEEAKKETAEEDRGNYARAYRY